MLLWASVLVLLQQWVSPKLCPLLSWSALILSHTYRRESWPKRRYCLQMEMEFELRYCIDHHDGKLLLFMSGPILVFLRIETLKRVPFSFRSIENSWHKCCICSLSSASREKLYCPVSTIFKPASEHSLVLRQSFESALIVLQVSLLLFVGRGAGNRRTSRHYFHLFQMISAADFTGALRSLGNCRINLLLLRRHWADSQKSLCGEATRCFHDYHWSVLTSCSLLCFEIFLSQRHWKHGKLDDRNLRNLPSYSLQIDSIIRRVYQSKFRVPFLFWSRPQERPTTAR